MKISKEDSVFLILMCILFWEMNPTCLYTSNQDEFNKIVLLLIVLGGNIYVITRNYQATRYGEVYKPYSVNHLENDWIILD